MRYLVNLIVRTIIIYKVILLPIKLFTKLKAYLYQYVVCQKPVPSHDQAELQTAAATNYIQLLWQRVVSSRKALFILRAILSDVPIKRKRLSMIG